MNCDRCEERPAKHTCDLRRFPGYAAHGAGSWFLCEPCTDMLRALLDGRPVFARGREPHPLTDALDEHRRSHARALQEASERVRVASAEAIEAMQRQSAARVPWLERRWGSANPPLWAVLAVCYAPLIVAGGVLLLNHIVTGRWLP